MKNFLILASALFVLAFLPVTKVQAQCPTQASVTLKTHTDITCFGANDGTITVDLADASTSEPFNFELVDLSIPAIVTNTVTEVEDKPGRGVVYSNVPPGTYAVFFIKAGCGVPLAIIEPPLGFNILEPAQLDATLNTITPACTPGTGAITIDVVGGTPLTGGPPNYTYAWTPGGSTVEDPTNLNAGTYSVTVTDKNGCTDVISGIVVPGQPTITLGAINNVCTGTTSSTLAYSGTTGSPDQFRIDWAAGITDVPLTALPATPIPINGIPVAPGTYTGTLFVKNSTTGCESAGNAVSVTVNALPIVSVPSTSLCLNATMTASPTTGGTWISSAPAVATITNAGLITGVSVGTATFTFTATATGCSNTTPTVTIIAPTVSVPSTFLCIGSTMIATPTTGGTWISNNPARATITNAGLITGVSAGTVTFTFTETATGCSNTTPTVTIRALPVVSVPSTSLCIGSTMTASPTTGGTWVSSAPAVATITNAGLITGISVGPVTFTFTRTATGCSNTTPTVNVITQPTVSVPSTSLCVGATMTASPTTGGTWISSAPGVATITNGGLITGVSAGTATFTFTLAGGCSNTTSTVTVNALPVVSVPSTSLCIGATMTASPTTGGTWISSAPGVATITNGGLITGVSAGTATFTFTLTGGCSNTTSTVTVNALPVVSVPSTSLCIGATMTASPTTGGTWISSAPGVATITNGGLITGVSAGTATFTFTLTGGCSNTTSTVTVNALPVVSVPSTSLCIGATMTASPTTGGTWISSAPGVATITNGGLITGVSAGTATFTFTLTGGCSNTTSTVTVNALPVVSVPSTSLCVGTTMTASPTTGGTWISSAPGVATITNGGLITGVSAGTATFTFTLTGGCSNTTPTVTVVTQPTVSVPSTSLCIGATMTASPTTGGTWISSAPGVATITNGGLITGVSAGTATFTFTLAGGCSNTTSTVTVNALPVVSVPSTSLCVGATMTASPTTGGTWISSAPGVATITNGGLITGVSAGTATFTFTLTGGCSNTTSTVTVNPTVVPSVIIAAVPGSTICAGTSVTFTATPTNGGASPTYQWKKNGVNVGTNSATYADAALANSDAITVDMTSNATCPTIATVTSNQITMTVNPNLVPSVTIGAAPGSTICAGTPVTFTATPTNGGTTPVYQWKKNGVNVGTNSTTFVSAVANGDAITVDMTSNATCPTTPTVTSNTITMTVNATVLPQVVISPNPGSTICAGTNVTFTATPVNGGTTPIYQWKKNGVNVGSNSVTYADATLANGDQITVDMTSNATCPVPATVTSNTVVMTVNPSVLPIVVITPNPGSTICAGTNVTFTAVPVNGGTTPSYQWKKNGVDVGTNSVTYADAGLANGDQINVVMTSNATCVSTPTATSNTINMTVNPTVVPSVSIAAAPNGAICAGTSVTFTATPTNGGTTPVYQWKKNGTNVGTNSTTYVDAGLNDADVIEVDMTSNATCPSTATVTSNQITMVVTPNVTPSVVISSNAGSTICTGDNVTFTAVPTNGGTTPAYQWKKNGVNVGTNSTTYSDAGLIDTDVIEVVLTSNAVCITSATANSNTITMTVVTSLTPTVSISADLGTTICNGSNVTFTATPVGGGITPAFQWIKNSVNVGTNSATYADASLVTGDVIEVQLTSSASCATTPTASSNQLTMTVNPTITPSVSIAAAPVGAICASTSVTFTATPTNGGATPIYQWKKNGVNVGTNSDTYVDAGLVDTDVIEVDMTSNATCPVPVTATSNQITMVVTASVTPSVVISSNVGSIICTGDNVTFTAVPTNGGTTPVYQWKKNGVNVGTNSTTYSDAGLNDTDAITVDMTSNATCASPAAATSNTVTMSVVTNLVPTISISANPGTAICPGNSVTFTATITGGGATPSFQWKKDGVNVGTNSSTYTDATLVPGNVITADLTSSASCASTPTVSSNTQTITLSSSCATGNCATVIIDPQSSPATCTLSNGSIFFDINPAVPSNNTVGVIITISGPKNETQFNQFTFTALPVGLYNYSITYGDPGCVKTGTVTVDQSGTVGTPIVSNPVSPSCFGSATGAVTIDVAGETGNPLQWSLNPADPLSWTNFTAGQPNGVQGIPAGTWIVSVRRTSADPCDAAAHVTITESATQITATFTTTSATCQGSDGTITITPGGAYTYELDATPVTPVANVISNVTGGNHIITAFDATGCASAFPVFVPFPGFVTYSAPATTIDATCTTTGVIGIFIPNPPGSYEIGFTTDPINQPTNYNSAYYNPATGLVLINKLAAGTYYVWIRTSSTSCPTRFENSPGVYEVIIGGPQPISFEVGCRDRDGVLNLNNISASASDPIFYEIFGNGFQKSGQITPNALAQDTIHGFTTGDYVVWLRQDQATFGCTVYSDTLSAPAGALDTLSVTKNVSFPDQPTGSIQVKLKGSGAEPYEAWLVETAFNSDTLTAVRNPVIFEVNFSSLAPATYSLYIEDAVGCRKTYEIIIPADDSIFIPNVFTPNNDGMNEQFYVRNLPSSGSKLIITNRWGKEVYTSNNYNPDNLWDGGGTPDGVYYYRLQIAGGGTFTGWVEIVRGNKP